MFALEQEHAGKVGGGLALEGLQVERVELPQTAVQFDLALMIETQRRVALASLQFNSDLFEAETIDRMAAHYRTLLESIVSQPNATIATLAHANRSRTAPTAGGME